MSSEVIFQHSIVCVKVVLLVNKNGVLGVGGILDDEGFAVRRD